MTKLKIIFLLILFITTSDVFASGHDQKLTEQVNKLIKSLNNSEFEVFSIFKNTDGTFTIYFKGGTNIQNISDNQLRTWFSEVYKMRNSLNLQSFLDSINNLASKVNNPLTARFNGAFSEGARIGYGPDYVQNPPHWLEPYIREDVLDAFDKRPKKPQEIIEISEEALEAARKNALGADQDFFKQRYDGFSCSPKQNNLLGNRRTSFDSSSFSSVEIKKPCINNKVSQFVNYTSPKIKLPIVQLTNPNTLPKPHLVNTKSIFKGATKISSLIATIGVGFIADDYILTAQHEQVIEQNKKLKALLERIDKLNLSESEQDQIVNEVLAAKELPEGSFFMDCVSFFGEGDYRVQSLAAQISGVRRKLHNKYFPNDSWFERNAM